MSDILFRWLVLISWKDSVCNGEREPKQKSEESEERERGNGKVIFKREREREKEGNGRRILTFSLRLFELKRECE